VRSKRTVFFISDRTGITAEMLGNSLLTQFEDFDFLRVTIPFVDTPERVAEAIRQVNETAQREGPPPLVISSVVDEAMSETIRRDTEALTLDLFQVFIQPLEAELGAKSSHAAGRSHGIANSHEYFARMEAINFTQAHDDGATTRDLEKAPGDPGRRVPLRQDPDIALSRAAVRHPGRKLSR
jgi:regulator of PEP synthase PpsR (kinase-PPPase family)